MFNKQKIVVYPYDSEFAPILRHKSLLYSYDIIGVVSPVGWGLVGKDATFTDEGENIGIEVSDKYEELLDACDAVMFVEAHLPLDFRKSIYPKVIKAVETKKNIISTMCLDEEISKEILELCETNGVCFKQYNVSKDAKLYKDINITSEFIYNLETPVIFVSGIAERTHKFEIQLSLREKLLAMGYKLSQVGSRNYCELMGFNSFPQFMYDNSISESNKVVLFNHYLRKIELEETPDIIIVGIPGGIMPFNNQFTNRFGILAYQLSQAVRPDFATFSTLFEDYKPEFFEKIFISIKYKLGFEVDCYNLSNVLFDLKASEFEKAMVYTTINSKFIDEKKKRFLQLETPVYNILNPNDANSMVFLLIDKLSGYGVVDCVQNVTQT